MSDIKRVEMRSPVGTGVIQVPESSVERFKARGFSVAKRQTRQSKAKPEAEPEAEPETDD